MSKESGFTLIELVVVIVILGILAATALPKFVNMSGDAGDAAAQGVAGAVSSAAGTNYAQYQISAGKATDIKSGTATCADLKKLLSGEAFPTDVDFVTSTTTITCTNPAGAGGTSTACMVKHSKGNTAAGFAATAICTS